MPKDDSLYSETITFGRNGIAREGGGSVTIAQLKEATDAFSKRYAATFLGTFQTNLSELGEGIYREGLVLSFVGVPHVPMVLKGQVPVDTAPAEVKSFFHQYEAFLYGRCYVTINRALGIRQTI